MLTPEGIMCPMCGSFPVPVVVSKTLCPGPSKTRRIPDTWHHDQPVAEARCVREGCRFRMILPMEDEE